ncbi:hypothetical protein [Micromonospora sp. 4G55]|uniref:hypothetical protein n=1 Tax=Micromonospora sp. 4G55 TaxID=2806102 RepID=UPI001A526775|nr:hypothetical protein [Micromonospora sp. 4G55]MBM0257485.1 hypothetical protein [Micromonospora sp. 4G55]
MTLPQFAVPRRLTSERFVHVPVVLGAFHSTVPLLQAAGLNLRIRPLACSVAIT